MPAQAKTPVSDRAPKGIQISALQVVGEQNAIAVDQAARLLEVSTPEMIRLAYEMRQRGWIGTEQFFPEAYPMMWLRRPGERHSQAPIEGDRAERPKQEEVRYRWAVNEARIYFAKQSSGLWVCRGVLRRDFRAALPNRHVPAGLVESRGDDGLIRRRAIEVGWRMDDLSEDPKPDSVLLEEMLAELIERYDGVDFFCGGEVHRFAVAEGLAERYKSLNIRELSLTAPLPEEIDDPYLSKLLFQAKRGEGIKLNGRSSQGRRRIIIHKAAVVHEIERETFPAEGLDEIAKAAGLSKPPEVRGVWATPQAGVKIYCVETDAGLYRVARSAHGWRADEVPDEGVFVKKPPYVYKRPRTIHKRIVVHRIDFDEMPAELPGAIATADDSTKEPKIVALWRKPGSGWKVYCAETEAGVYRVIGRADRDWKAERVDGDVVFIKKDPVPPRRRYFFEGPATVYPISLDEMPAEVPQAIATAEQSTKAPKVIAIWQKPDLGWKIYCAETETGVYRVVGTGGRDWHAHRVDGDRVFIKKTGLPPEEAWPGIVEPGRFEIDAKLWAKIEPLLPAPGRNQFHSGAVRYSNRAILSGILYLLREELPTWKELPLELGYGGGSGCARRLRRWQEKGAWDSVQKILEAELPDGKELLWERLIPGQRMRIG